MQVCHGDLKTRNVLLTRNYTAKVADVGLSQIIDVAGNNASATACETSFTDSLIASLACLQLHEPDCPSTYDLW